MPPVESMMVPLGTPAPWFELPNHGVGGGGSAFSIRDDMTDPKVVVIMFWCNHCPFVKHLADEVAAMAHSFADRSVGFVAINANDADGYPDDAPDRMTEDAEARGYPFPYLFDEDQSVAREFRAACTPDFFVYDGSRRLVYRGRFDSSRPGGDERVTGDDLRDAIERALADEPLRQEQLPSVGCSIKWKPGNEPG